MTNFIDFTGIFEVFIMRSAGFFSFPYLFVCKIVSDIDKSSKFQFVCEVTDFPIFYGRISIFIRLFCLKLL